MKISTFSLLFYWNLYFLFTSPLKSLLSLYFSIEISTFSLLFYWNPYFLFTFLLKSILSLYFSIEISTFSLLFYWNLDFLCTFLFKSLLSLYFSIEISTFSLQYQIYTFFLLFYWNLYFLYTFLLKSLLSLYFSFEISTVSILFYSNLSFPLPLNFPANASSTLQLHSPIICRTLLSFPRPLNPPAIGNSRGHTAILAAPARPTHPTFAPTPSRFYCKTQHLARNLTFSPHLCCLHNHWLHIPLLSLPKWHDISFTSPLFPSPFQSHLFSTLRNSEVSSKLPLIKSYLTYKLRRFELHITYELWQLQLAPFNHFLCFGNVVRSTALERCLVWWCWWQTWRCTCTPSWGTNKSEHVADLKFSNPEDPNGKYLNISNFSWWMCMGERERERACVRNFELAEVKWSILAGHFKHRDWVLDQRRTFTSAGQSMTKRSLLLLWTFKALSENSIIRTLRGCNFVRHQLANKLQQMRSALSCIQSH